MSLFLNTLGPIINSFIFPKALGVQLSNIKLLYPINNTFSICIHSQKKYFCHRYDICSNCHLSIHILTYFKKQNSIQCIWQLLFLNLHFKTIISIHLIFKISNEKGADVGYQLGHLEFTFVTANIIPKIYLKL